MRAWLVLGLLALLCFSVALPVQPEHRNRAVTALEPQHQQQKRALGGQFAVWALKAVTIRTVGLTFYAITGSKLIGTLASGMWVTQIAGFLAKYAAKAASAGIVRGSHNVLAGVAFAAKTVVAKAIDHALTGTAAIAGAGAVAGAVGGTYAGIVGDKNKWNKTEHEGKPWSLTPLGEETWRNFTKEIPKNHGDMKVKILMPIGPR